MVPLATARSRPFRWLIGLLCLALATATAAPVGAASQPSTAAVWQAPAVVPVDAVRQSRTLQEAFDLVMSRFVQVPDSAALLRAAWERIALEAAQQKAPDPGPAPAFTGQPEADIAAARAALAGYLARAPEAPEGFIAAHAAARGMAMLVNEGHTYFLNPEQYRDQLAWSRGDVKYSGIGARMRGTDMTVVEVFANSPAERAGLKAGDVVLAVDGTSVTGMPLEQGIGLVRGPDGTWVALLVRRPGEPRPFTLRVQRGQIALDFVVSRSLEEGIGYVALRGFPEQRVADQFEAAVQSLTDSGAKALVVDLRGNSGGRLDVGNRLLNRFVPAGTSLYQQIERSGRQQTRAARGSSQYGLPLVVLVDGGTASMGEIFASALQETGTATILGTKTAGSVAAAQVFPLGDGSALQITVMEILSGSGKKLNGVGVLPDEVIDSTASLAPGALDPVVDRARQILEAQLASPLAWAIPSIPGHFSYAY